MKEYEVRERDILKFPNVVGYGIGKKNGDGPVGITVLVEKKLPPQALAHRETIPTEIQGAKTDVIEVGRIVAYNHKARYRPCPAGVSIGHYQVTAGTFGVVVKDLKTDRRLILSNNHVLANSNDAAVGDPILQPGSELR